MRVRARRFHQRQHRSPGVSLPGFCCEPAVGKPSNFYSSTGMPQDRGIPGHSCGACLWQFYRTGGLILAANALEADAPPTFDAIA